MIFGVIFISAVNTVRLPSQPLYGHLSLSICSESTSAHSKLLGHFYVFTSNLIACMCPVCSHEAGLCLCVGLARMEQSLQRAR